MTPGTFDFPFKFETHAHCSPASACGREPPETVVECYARAGYSGMFLTDHFFNGNCGIPDGLPWPERVRAFCDGFHRASRRGAEIGFRVFFGYEFAWRGAEFLILNANEKFLLENPGLLHWDMLEFLERARADGAFVVHAHPCRVAPHITDPGRRFPLHIDAVEVFNASHNPVYNPPAAQYAAECGLPALSGSDNHNPFQIQGAGVALRQNPATAAEFVAVIKSGEYAMLA